MTEPRRVDVEARVDLAVVDGVARLMLERPRRHNALVPELLAGLEAALAAAAAARPEVLVLAAAGRSFSTGGDVAAFAARPRGARRAYADGLVGALNRAILALVDFPAPVVARVHGPVTGGSVGLIAAADAAILADTAFVQSYHLPVGFAPDGGWTALVPARIGAGRARAALVGNLRLGAAEAVAAGLGAECVAGDDLDAAVGRWVARFRRAAPGAVAAARRLLIDRAALAAALEAERAAFLDLIETDAAEAGMARFLNGDVRGDVSPTHDKGER
jgi:2-(1,2-epoxy-1,2-dihydrophenyl)acetyl-CoA isomerase